MSTKVYNNLMGNSTAHSLTTLQSTQNRCPQYYQTGSEFAAKWKYQFDRFNQSHQVKATNTSFGYPDEFDAAFEGGVLGVDGNIYCIPFNSDRVLMINSITENSEWLNISVGTGAGNGLKVV